MYVSVRRACGVLRKVTVLLLLKVVRSQKDFVHNSTGYCTVHPKRRGGRAGKLLNAACCSLDLWSMFLLVACFATPSPPRLPIAVSTTPRTWSDAQDHCASYGGHLIIIDDNAENEAAYSACASAIFRTPW